MNWTLIIIIGMICLTIMIISIMIAGVVIKSFEIDEIIEDNESEEE